MTESHAPGAPARLRRLAGRLSTGQLVLLSTLAVFALSLNGSTTADHPDSLLELSYALWAHHSIVLGKVGVYTPNSVDVMPYKGNYYSALAPGVAFLALPFTGLGFLLDGKFTLSGDALLLSELFVALCDAAAAYLVFRLGSIYFSAKTSAFLAFAFAFATIAWPLGTFFFESDVSAMLDLAAVYLAITMARRGSADLPTAISLGAALGAAVTVAYANLLLLPILSVFLLHAFRKGVGGSAKGLVGMLGAWAVPVALLGLYDYAAFGNPLVTSEQVYDGMSSVFASFSYPLLNGLYLDLFSPLRGVFLYCPVLVLGAVGLWAMARRVPGEALLLAACFTAVLVPYSMWYNAVGGEAFGQRFLVSGMAFLLLPAGFMVEANGRGRLLAYLLYGVGVLFNGVAAVTNAIPQAEAVSHFPFLTQVLPRFLSGPLSVWWWRGSAAIWWTPGLLIIAAALLIPLRLGFGAGLPAWGSRRGSAVALVAMAVVSVCLFGLAFLYSPPGGWACWQAYTPCRSTPSVAAFEAFLRWDSAYPMYSNLAVWTMEIAAFGEALWCLRGRPRPVRETADVPLVAVAGPSARELGD